MPRRPWVYVVPVVLLLGAGGRAVLMPERAKGADRRIVCDRVEKLEADLGYHLYAPTWLPYEGRPGRVIRGAKRILQDFSDNKDRTILIVSQEPLSKERDTYHTRIFRDPAEARAMVNTKSGYFITGSSGERRLFWNEKDAAVIISSSVLNDEEMLDVACRIE